MWEVYLPSRAMVTYGLRLLLKTTSGSVSLRQSESMMFTAHVVTKGHRDGYTGSGPQLVAGRGGD